MSGSTPSTAAVTRRFEIASVSGLLEERGKVHRLGLAFGMNREGSEEAGEGAHHLGELVPDLLGSVLGRALDRVLDVLF